MTDRPPLFRARTVLCLTLGILLALTTVSCGRFSRRGVPIEEPTRTPIDYGSDLKFSPPATADKGNGGLTIFVAEEGTNLPIAGAIVEYKGPQKGSMVTDGNGRASTQVKPGAYTVSLPPCGRSVMITTYAEARVGVVPGGEAGGPLFTTWEQRFRPTPSVQTSDQPPWKRNERVTLGIRIEDGCDFSEAPGARMTYYAWTSDDTFSFLKQPTLTADSQGYARVTIQCNRRGNGEVVIFNRFDPEEKINLIDALSAPKNGDPFCE